MIIFIYVLRVVDIDVLYSVTTSRYLIDSYEEQKEFETFKGFVTAISDFFDYVIGYVVLYLFHHYASKHKKEQE